MAGGQLALIQQDLHPVRQVQQPQRIGNVAAALPDMLRQVFLGVAEFLQQAAIAVGFLQRREILALDVLDDGELERLRSEEHTSELQSLMRISYAVFCLNKQPEKHQ